MRIRLASPGLAVLLGAQFPYSADTSNRLDSERRLLGESAKTLELAANAIVNRKWCEGGLDGIALAPARAISTQRVEGDATIFGQLCGQEENTFGGVAF